MYSLSMDYITTTNLRTQTTKLIDELKKGKSVSLIHRSKIVGVIEPAKPPEAAPINVEEFRKFLKEIKPKKIIPRKDREKIYRAHLEEKYGKGVS